MLGYVWKGAGKGLGGVVGARCSLQMRSAAIRPDSKIVGNGDYDGNGSEDVLFEDPDSGVVTLWLTTTGGPVAAAVASPLAPGESVASGASGSDESGFRRQLCSADFDGDGVVAVRDASMLGLCIGGAASGNCENMDLNGDGDVSLADLSIVSLYYGGPSCPDGF